MVIMFFSAFILFHSYLLHRIWHAFALFPKFQKIAVISIAFLTITYILNALFSESLPISVTKIYSKFGAFWIYTVIMLFFAVLFFDILRLANSFFPPQFYYLNSKKIKFIAMILLFCLVSFSYIRGYINFTNPQLTVQEIVLNKSQNISTNISNSEEKNENLVKNKKKLNIIAASDLHLSYLIDKSRFSKYVDMINSQNPDIVFLLGDIIETSVEPILEQKMEEEFARIRAKHGIFVIAGNHEGIRRKQSYSKIMNFYEQFGFTVLQDSTVLVNDEFYVIGRKDRSASNRKQINDLTANISDKSKPIILLDHQPYDLDKTVAAGIDLQLSGHTHNGQFFPVTQIVKRIYELPYGYKRKGYTHFFVSSGLGLWGPLVRLGSISELVKINLQY